MPFNETNRRKSQTGMMVDISDRHDPRQYGLAACFPKSMDTRPTRAYDVEIDRHASSYGPTPATGSCSFHAHRRQGRGTGADACFT
jgi:hypothetical protein